MKQDSHHRPHTAEELPLTNSQQLIWAGQSLNPELPLYNMSMCFEISGDLDVAVFQEAFRELVRQSDAMRTIFFEREGQVLQRTIRDFDAHLELLDWSAHPDLAAGLKEWASARSRKVFDLSRQLFDSVLIKLSAGQFVWFLNEHHLITDAWGMTLQYRALAGFYQTLSSGEDFTERLPAFQDYVKEQTTSGVSPRKQAALDHWQQKVTSLPRPPEFYGRRLGLVSTDSERVHLTLGKDRTEDLRRVALSPAFRSWTEHASLFNIFASLLLAYLHRVSGQQKLAIGTPAHNRTTARHKQIPGLFIELFPLAVELETAETYHSLFEKVRDETNSFLKYAHAGTSSPALSRGYNVVLNYINAAFPDFNDMPVRVNWIHPDHKDPAHHLRLQVHDLDQRGEMQLHFDLNTEVFDEGLRTEAPKHFLRLLDDFLENPEGLINRSRLVEGAGAIEGQAGPGEQFKAESTVLDLFGEVLAQQEDNEAIVIENQSISYKDLEERSNQLAHFLLDNGLRHGDRVALVFRRAPEYLISLWAVLKAGGVFVPIPVNYPSGRILGILHDAGTRLILTTTDLGAALKLPTENRILLDVEQSFIAQLKRERPTVAVSNSDLAYLMYTSGSSGLPKGVMIDHGALAHYVQWARSTYVKAKRPVMPLFTSIGFDLTITSTFVPILAGGTIVCYPQIPGGPDLALLDVLKDQRINMIKLTPSHLEMLKGQNLGDSPIRTMIVGGEFFKASLAKQVTQQFPDGLQMFNEYGPTEATVGCVVYRFNPATDGNLTAVPIGRPISRTTVYILDEHRQAVPEGVAGELYIAGKGLAAGYWNQAELTTEKFVTLPTGKSGRMYQSGDLVRVDRFGRLDYLGRKDEQVKINGRRVELEEIAATLSSHAAVESAVVSLMERPKKQAKAAEHNCVRCGLPSNYPKAEFDEEGVCHLCRSFGNYQENVQKYFRTLADLEALFAETKSRGDRNYDCIMLLSGGKDSTYALAQLVEMDLRVLAFTLDNGYISEQAKANIRRVVGELGVDHVFGTTPAMNEIFVDSLQRHCNVCDGCFKTIYTLSIQLALEKDIPYIVTGLSRGQFFETRLTEELFTRKDFNADEIDDIILNARKSYHQVDDAVKRLMDVSMFEHDEVFEKVQFVDFYRFTDVSLDDMLQYLDQRLPWVRPTDTGRSTNCLINQAGIFVHKQEKGYSNYAFPYSWDVRIGHKTREASLEEINEKIDEGEVKKILDEIGYTEAEAERSQAVQLVAYYTADRPVEERELQDHLLSLLPDYMVPVQFIHLPELPLTVNGKIDRDALPTPDLIRPKLKTEYRAPRNDLEELLEQIWSEFLGIDKIGIFDNFIEIGGDSLTGIRLMARINETLNLDLPVNLIFEKPTIAGLGTSIETTIQALLAEMDSAE